MSILLGMAAMEAMGLLALSGVSLLGIGSGPWGVPPRLAVVLALAIGMLATYAAGRMLGVLNMDEADTYRERIDALHATARAGRRVRTEPRRQSYRRPVAIEY